MCSTLYNQVRKTSDHPHLRNYIGVDQSLPAVTSRCCSKTFWKDRQSFSRKIKSLGPSSGGQCTPKIGANLEPVVRGHP